MTFKSIVENIVQHDAQNAIQKVTGNMMELESIRWEKPDDMFRNWTATFYVNGLYYVVSGFISDIGVNEVVCWQAEHKPGVWNNFDEEVGK